MRSDGPRVAVGPCDVKFKFVFTWRKPGEVSMTSMPTRNQWPRPAPPLQHPPVTGSPQATGAAGWVRCPDCGNVMQAMMAGWECPGCGWIEIAPAQATGDERDDRAHRRRGPVDRIASTRNVCLRGACSRLRYPMRRRCTTRDRCADINAREGFGARSGDAAPWRVMRSGVGWARKRGGLELGSGTSPRTWSSDDAVGRVTGRFPPRAASLGSRFSGGT